MSSTCHAIVRHLALHGPTVAVDLAQRLERAPLTVYRALRQLQAKGLVCKSELPQDGPGRAPCEWAVKTEDLKVANEPLIKGTGTHDAEGSEE